MKKYKRLQKKERENISQMLAQNKSYQTISRVLNRNVSTISREAGRLKKTYLAYVAQADAESLAKKRNCKTKIEKQKHLWELIKEKLSLKWSPEQISQHLKQQYPDDKSMQLSHESIYTYLYVLPKEHYEKSSKNLTL